MNYEHHVATLISRIFDPFVMFGVLFVVLFYRSSIFVPAFIFMVLLPLVLFVIAWKTKFVSNWDVSDRTQRPKILWTLLAIEGISSVILKTNEGIPILVALFVFACISHFWKISGHAMAAALSTGYIVARFGWGWWPVLLIVPVIAWARVVRKDHTVTQVVAGAAYSWLLLLVVLDNLFI